MLEGLFGEYHSSSAALGQQRPEVTKQPLVCDWSATSKALCAVNRRFARNTAVKFVQGVNTMTVKDLARPPLHQVSAFFPYVVHCHQYLMVLFVLQEVLHLPTVLCRNALKFKFISNSKIWVGPLILAMVKSVWLSCNEYVFLGETHKCLSNPSAPPVCMMSA